MNYPHIEPLEARIAPATLTLSNARILEGDSATATLTFTATLSAAETADVTFTLATQNGTAVAGSDFVAKTSNVTIPAGMTSATFQVTVNGDNAFEATESLFVNLTGASANATVVNNNPISPTVQATARGYILNDDTQTLGSNQAQWIDVDGDLVTLTVSKGGNFLTTGSLLTLVDAGTVGGLQLQRMDLTAFGNAFAGANISIIATRQAGFPDATDGEVDVGFLKATTFDPDELRAVGVDLGTVTIDGDLARITAGDSFATPAIVKLDVISLGKRGTSTLAAVDAPAAANVVVESKVLGPITSIVVKDDVNSFLRVIGAEFGIIGSLKVGDSLAAVGSTPASGTVSVSGRLGSATIGNIIGGAGENSGLLLGSGLGASVLGKITVTGSITGGTGANSGKIQAPKIGDVSVGGMTGGGGALSGSIISNSTLGKVTIEGDLIGGGGVDSGKIAAETKLGAVFIGGKVTGAVGADSGSVVSGGSIASLSVGGGMTGGSGAGSGSVRAAVNASGTAFGTGNIGAVTFGKDAAGDSIKGGTGTNSGRLDIAGNISSFTAAGDVEGGTGNGSGSIAAGIITKLVISESLVGADSGATALTGSGAIQADWLKSVTITKDIVAGKKTGAGAITASGAILANRIDSITIGGKLDGDATNPVFINVTGLAGDLALKSLKVTGAVEFAKIRAGYNNTAAVSADASIGTVMIGGTVTALDIIAGAQTGADGRFGTADDALASGSGIKDIAGVISKIASVVFQSPTAIVSNPAPAAYGIVAQHVAAVTIGATKVPLQIGAGNDVAATSTDLNPGIELGSVGSRFRALELRLPL